MKQDANAFPPGRSYLTTVLEFSIFASHTSFLHSLPVHVLLFFMLWVWSLTLNEEWLQMLGNCKHFLANSGQVQWLHTWKVLWNFAEGCVYVSLTLKPHNLCILWCLWTSVGAEVWMFDIPTIFMELFYCFLLFGMWHDPSTWARGVPVFSRCSFCLSLAGVKC